MIRALPLARYARVWPLLNWTLFVIGAVYCAIIAAGLGGWDVTPLSGVVASDAHSYQHAALTPEPYVWTGTPYRYSPAFLWVVWPFAWLPWPVFGALFFAFHLAAFVWLRAPWMLAIPGLNEDVIRGNVNVFLAVIVVLALTRSAAWWMPVLLTKVTPGVGVLWHAGRREWRALALAAGVTAIVVAIGAATDPNLWLDWARSLQAGPETYETGHVLGPLWLRLGLAAGLTLYAGWSDRAWLVPVAMVVAVPGLWPGSFALLAAIPRLRGHKVGQPSIGDVSVRQPRVVEQRAP